MLIGSIEGIDARLRRLEEDINRSPVRISVGGGGGALIRTVLRLPDIPTAGADIVYLHSIDWLIYTTTPPIYTVLMAVDSLMDTYWWTTPQDAEWHPIGGKLVDMVGLPGDVSGV